MRPLTLHASALNDDEYEVYTTNLRDLSWTRDEEQDVLRDDKYFEDLQISLREMRGWLRGRYSSFPSTTVDAILRCVSSELKQNQILSGGQVFAVMRLATHTYSGRDVDRALGFVQAHPNGDPRNNSNPHIHSTTSANSEDSETIVPPLPPRKSAFPVALPRRGATPDSGIRKSSSPSRITAANVASSGQIASHSHPKFPILVSNVPSTLIKQSLRAGKIAQTLKRTEERREQDRVTQVLKTSSLVTGTSVVNRDRSVSPTGRGLSSSSEESSNSSRKSTIAPPLPRRRDTHSNGTGCPTSRPEHEFVRSWEQHPLSAGTAPQLPFLGSDPHTRQYPEQMGYAGTRRSLPHMPSGRAFGVAGTRPHTRGSSHPVSPPPPNTSTSNSPSGNAHCEYLAPIGSRGPPPTHPDRKQSYDNSLPLSSSPTHTSFSDGSRPFNPSDPQTQPSSETSPTSRVHRSRSLHNPPLLSTPSPTPPPRRKRPESVQVFSSSNTIGVNGRQSPFEASQGPNGPASLLHHHLSHLNLQRRSSLSASQSSPFTHQGGVPYGPIAVPAPLTKLVQTFHGPPARHLFEKARYKAEAGLSRKGYFGRGGGDDGGEGLLKAKGDRVYQPGYRGGEWVWSKGFVAQGRLRSKSAPGEFDPPDVDYSGEEDEEDIDDEGEDESTLPVIGRGGQHETEEEKERRTWKREIKRKRGGHERDALKWPVTDGEGWKLL